MKRIPIGYSDFKRIITTPDFLYVDKTGLIEEFLADPVQVLLITRPRRFGKTLNLSTLRYFFDQENAVENRKLFDGLKVSKNQAAMAEQGKRPMLYLTFKDCKELQWVDLQKKIFDVLAELVIPWVSKEPLELEEPDQEFLRNIRSKTLDIIDASNSLKFLSRILSQHYGQNPLILIDEYDVPLQSAWTGGYWDEAISFFRNFFSAGFKDNPYLWRGVITGCLRVARESMFTGMNNLKVCGVSATDYSKHFGFTVPEVKQLIQDYNLKPIEAQIESWYNGYIFGETEIYNPWSILNLIEQKGVFRPYWMNTSGNDLVKEILGRSGVDAKKDLEDLMAGLSITVPLQEQVVFQEIENTPTNLWNFLYFTGYLKAIKIEVPPAVPKALVHLKVPNSEVAQIFDDSVQYWFASSKSLSLLQNLRTCLRDGDEDEFEEIFRELVSDSFSYFDVDGKKPEKFYHGFVLGLIVSFSDTWHIRSNRESGMGRCDILMIPKDPKNFGVVIELKTHRSRKESDLIETAKRALEQIEERQYELELRSQGATKIMKIGIGFMGKQLEVLSTIKV